MPEGVRLQNNVTQSAINKDRVDYFALNNLSSADLACVASVSVQFRREERGTRVKDREKGGASKRQGRNMVIWAQGSKPKI